MKKKILFIYGQLNGGGAERVLLDILNNFNYKEYEVDLCQIVAGGTFVNEVPKQVNLISLWPDYSFSYKLAIRLSYKFGCNFIFKRKLSQKLTKQYDIEISFLEGFPLKLHAMMNTKAKKISWVHCDLFKFHYTKNQFRRGEELAAYNKMDKIVCVAEDTKKAFEKRFPTCTAEKVVIYNPIDKGKIIKMSNEYSLPKNDKFTIITSGRLTIQKKMDRVIRLAKRFKDENLDVHFQILGDGELKEDLLALRAQLNVEDRVEFLGFQRNPFPYVKRADMMFCCSGYEGFCLVICEAMCLGIPVISTKTSGPIEILENNKYGLLVEHDDDSMFQGLKYMYLNSELRKKYAELGRLRCDRFDVKFTMKQIELLYGYDK